MSRIPALPVDASPAASRPLLDAVQRQLGTVPNLFKVLAHSPAVLEGQLALGAALSKGRLDAGQRERLAIAIAESNGCDYCLAAHAYLGEKLAGLSADEVAAAREARSGDPRAAALLRFLRAVQQARGAVGDAELAAFRAAGFDDAAALEVVGAVAANVLTNFANNLAGTEVDFPRLTARAAA
jgi:uncharacterized peroxidase-related enzyme